MAHDASRTITGPPSLQDRPPNFRDDLHGEGGNLYLVRCYACDPEHGRENWAVMVASGTCAFCGWKEESR